MSLYYTTTIKRKHAIKSIVDKRIEPIKKEIEFFLNGLSNEEIEKLLYENKVSIDEYEDFDVVDDDVETDERWNIYE